MKKYFLVLLNCLSLLLAVLINGCKEQASRKLSFTCEVVDSILQKDQFYRNYLYSPKSSYIILLDSLLVLNGYKEGFKMPMKIDSNLLMRISNQMDTLFSTSHKSQKKVLDSIVKLQDELDYKNVMQVISIISSVGYSNIDTIPDKCGLNSFIVFVHTPTELFDTVRTVIEQINLKSFNPNRYNHIMWHLNGRKR